MKTYSPQVFLALILLLCRPAVAQLVPNTFTKMGTKVAKDYSNVQGKYLWSADWHRAAFLMKPGNIIKMNAVKLNLYTNEVQYPGDKGDMAAGIDNIRNIILYSNDTKDSTAVVATFDVLTHVEANSTVRRNFIYEVMNTGKIQLLKRVTVSSQEKKPDPITGGGGTYFYSTSDYMIRNDTDLKPVKSLSKSTVFEVIPEDPSYKEWLPSNKNKLKNEDDVVEFFNYLNSK